MSMRKLGRGLDSLISQPPEVKSEQRVLQIDPNKILTNPDQPRKRFSLQELEELKGSIAKEGILQPVLVREKSGQYELIAGERRLRASKELGLATIPAILLAANDDRMLELALVENIHRENLNPIELAQAFRQLSQLKSWTQDALAQNLGLSRSGVSNTIRLLDLPDDIQNAIARGQITMGHAKVLLSVGDPKEQRLLFEKIAEEKLSVRDLEGARMPDGASTQRLAATKRSSQLKSANVQGLEEELGRALGLKVRIREGRGKGRVSIEFYSHDDFERLRKLLAGASGGK